MAIYYILSRSENGICWKERNGTKLKNDYGLDLFIEKRNDSIFAGKRNKKLIWVITEAKTGSKLAEGHTRKLAIEKFKNFTDYIGMDVIVKKANEVINIYGVSPLYTDNPKLPVIPLEKEVTD